MCRGEEAKRAKRTKNASVCGEDGSTSQQSQNARRPPSFFYRVVVVVIPWESIVVTSCQLLAKDYSSS